MNSDKFPIYWLVATYFGLGLFLSFLPAIVGGWALATWIYEDRNLRTKNSGAIKGFICGTIAMFGFDFVVGLLSLPSPHGPPLGIFLFYVILSTVIASLAGAVVGSQLVHKISKVNE